MNWTQFVGIMRDGKMFNFGTSGSREFFEFPEGYTNADLADIKMHNLIEGEAVYQERSYFNLYMEGLLLEPKFDNRYERR
jgi:hypothetical protein